MNFHSELHSRNPQVQVLALPRPAVFCVYLPIHALSAVRPRVIRWDRMNVQVADDSCIYGLAFRFVIFIRLLGVSSLSSTKVLEFRCCKPPAPV